MSELDRGRGPGWMARCVDDDEHVKERDEKGFERVWPARWDLNHLRETPDSPIAIGLLRLVWETVSKAMDDHW